MHELGIAQGILAVVDDIAAGRPVRRIVVQIGDEQRVAPDSLEFGFALLAEGTVCETARLECVRVDGDTILVDEVEVGGDTPEVLRRPRAEIVEPPHAHLHEHPHGAAAAPIATATSHGGS